MALLDLVSELVGTIPGLAPQLATKQINRALTNIYSERLWSFLNIDGYVVCPAAVIAGSAAITQYSNTVTLDTDASAALLAQTLPGAIPGIQNLSIRFGATSPAAGQIYNIQAADTTIPIAIVLTLNRIVLEATNAAAGYQVYRPYITPPIPDFLRWESVVDMINAITLWDNRVNRTSAEFDARDPQRQAQGMAYLLGSYAGAYVSDPVLGTILPINTVDPGTNLYELWPHPTNGQTFYVRIRRRGPILISQSDTQPAALPDSLILHCAKAYETYPFCKANIANYPSMKGVDWTDLIRIEKGFYNDYLLDAKRNDDEAALQTVWNRGHGLRTGSRGYFKGDTNYPIDANWIQSHLVRF